MSIYFEIGDKVLWNPSNSVARIFKGEAEVIASAFHTASGLGDIINDECEIDLPVFEEFLEDAVRQHDRTNNSIFISLTTGFIATAMVMAERAGGRLPESGSQRSAEWAELRAQHARSMPR